MRIGVLSRLFALLLILTVSSFALETKCVVIGPVASDLKAIARAAADAQREAAQLEAYLRSTSPDWRWVYSQMGILEDHVRSLRRMISAFERNEPKLTEAQARELERMKAGLATLTVFVNETYRVLADKRLLWQRNTLTHHAKAMYARARVIRQAARNLQVVQPAA
jgi:septal ring factor EnvC (AmiA/AmiB activator)